MKPGGVTDCGEEPECGPTLRRAGERGQGGGRAAWVNGLPRCPLHRRPRLRVLRRSHGGRLGVRPARRTRLHLSRGQPEERRVRGSSRTAPATKRSQANQQHAEDEPDSGPRLPVHGGTGENEGQSATEDEYESKSRKGRAPPTLHVPPVV